MIVSLTGFMGCGKSSVGQRVSELLGWPFVDLDEYIEAQKGCRISDVFRLEGEAAFREAEAEALREVIDTHKDTDLILSLGGGTVMTPKCAEMVRTMTKCIYLRAGIETLISHLRGETEGRPLLQSSKGLQATAEDLHSRISALMAQRSTTYENTAHLILDTDSKSIEEISSLISSELLETLNL